MMSPRCDGVEVKEGAGSFDLGVSVPDQDGASPTVTGGAAELVPADDIAIARDLGISCPGDASGTIGARTPIAGICT